MITVFYDEQCGLCSKTMRYYRQIAPKGIFDWCDVTESADILQKAGVSLEQALRLLHVQDADGVFHTGIDALILIWEQLHYWRLLALFISLPIVYQIGALSYTIVAKYRSRKPVACQRGAKPEIKSK